MFKCYNLRILICGFDIKSIFQGCKYFIKTWGLYIKILCFVQWVDQIHKVYIEHRVIIFLHWDLFYEHICVFLCEFKFLGFVQSQDLCELSCLLWDLSNFSHILWSLYHFFMINLTLENSFITKFKHLLKNLSFLLFGRLDSIPEKSIKKILIHFFKLLTYD